METYMYNNNDTTANGRRFFTEKDAVSCASPTIKFSMTSPLFCAPFNKHAVPLSTQAGGVGREKG
ncbi:MAG: hypothetical protein PHH13_01810 [Candidatus Peribacteraceae bacterium]|nr:hypothetical protein [Candidatus Peribacteraceae bacterium]